MAVGANARGSLASGDPMAPSMLPKSIGTKRTANARAKSLVVCIGNEGYPASLERRKIYASLRDAEAEKHGLTRIIGESGDSYLYPKALFRLIDLPQAVKRAVLAAA
jgi:hypothetical protein